MGSTMVASFLPNGEWFTGKGGEKAAVKVLLAGKLGRRRSSSRRGGSSTTCSRRRSQGGGDVVLGDGCGDHPRKPSHKEEEVDAVIEREGESREGESEG